MFRVSPRKCRYIRHNFLPYHLQFITHQSLYDSTLHNVTNWKGCESGKQKIIYNLKEVSTATGSDTILSGNQTHQFVTQSDVLRTCSVSFIRELISLLALFRIVVNGMFFLGRHYFCHTLAVCKSWFFSKDISPIKVVKRLLLKSLSKRAIQRSRSNVCPKE